MLLISLAALAGCALAVGAWFLWDGMEAVEMADDMEVIKMRADSSILELRRDGRRDVAIGSASFLSGIALLGWLFIQGA